MIAFADPTPDPNDTTGTPIIVIIYCDRGTAANIKMDHPDGSDDRDDTPNPAQRRSLRRLALTGFDAIARAKHARLSHHRRLPPPPRTRPRNRLKPNHRVFRTHTRSRHWN